MPDNNNIPNGFIHPMDGRVFEGNLSFDTEGLFSKGRDEAITDKNGNTIETERLSTGFVDYEVTKVTDSDGLVIRSLVAADDHQSDITYLRTENTYDKEGNLVAREITKYDSVMDKESGSAKHQILAVENISYFKNGTALSVEKNYSPDQNRTVTREIDAKSNMHEIEITRYSGSDTIYAQESYVDKHWSDIDKEAFDTNHDFTSIDRNEPDSLNSNVTTLDEDGAKGIEATEAEIHEFIPDADGSAEQYTEDIELSGSPAGIDDSQEDTDSGNVYEARYDWDKIVEEDGFELVGDVETSVNEVGDTVETKHYISEEMDTTISVDRTSVTDPDGREISREYAITEGSNYDTVRYFNRYDDSGRFTERYIVESNGSIDADGKVVNLQENATEQITYNENGTAESRYEKTKGTERQEFRSQIDKEGNMHESSLTIDFSRSERHTGERYIDKDWNNIYKYEFDKNNDFGTKDNVEANKEDVVKDIEASPADSANEDSIAEAVVEQNTDNVETSEIPAVDTETTDSDDISDHVEAGSNDGNNSESGYNSDVYRGPGNIDGSQLDLIYRGDPQIDEKGNTIVSSFYEDHDSYGRKTYHETTVTSPEGREISKEVRVSGNGQIDDYKIVNTYNDNGSVVGRTIERYDVTMGMDSHGDYPRIDIENIKYFDNGTAQSVTIGHPLLPSDIDAMRITAKDIDTDGNSHQRIATHYIENGATTFKENYFDKDGNEISKDDFDKNKDFDARDKVTSVEEDTSRDVENAGSGDTEKNNTDTEVSVGLQWKDENGHEHNMTADSTHSTHVETWSDEQDGVKVDHEVTKQYGDGDDALTAHVNEREVAHYEDGSTIETVSSYRENEYGEVTMESVTVTDITDEDNPDDVQKTYYDDNGEMLSVDNFDKDGNLDSFERPEIDDTADNMSNEVDDDPSDGIEKTDDDSYDDDDDYDQVDFG